MRVPGDLRRLRIDRARRLVTVDLDDLADRPGDTDRTPGHGSNAELLDPERHLVTAPEHDFATWAFDRQRRARCHIARRPQEIGRWSVVPGQEHASTVHGDTSARRFAGCGGGPVARGHFEPRAEKGA